MKRFNAITLLVATLVLAVAGVTFAEAPQIVDRSAPPSVAIKDAASMQAAAGDSRGCDNYYYYDDTATVVTAFTIPDAYGDDLFNTRFTVGAGVVCTLKTAYILMYGYWMTGTPSMRVYLWDDDGSGFPGARLDSVDIPYSSLPTGFGWVGADFSPGLHVFEDGEEFHLGWTLLGETGDTLACVADLATGPHNGEQRCSEYWGGNWHTMLDDWGQDHVFFMEAQMCCSGEGEVTNWLSGAGAGSGDTIIAGRPVTFNIHFYNNSTQYIPGSANGFRLYSPESATWQLPVSSSTGALEPYYDLITSVNESGVTGSNDDTIGIIGAVATQPGVPPWFDEDVLTISTQVAATHTGKTLCIDSTWFPPAGDWLWAFAGGSFVPEWGGPYCYQIVDECETTLSAFGFEHYAAGSTCLDLHDDTLTLTQRGPDYDGGVAIELVAARGWDARFLADPNPQPAVEIGLEAHSSSGGEASMLVGDYRFVIDDTGGHFQVYGYEGSGSYHMEFLAGGEVVYELDHLTDMVPPVLQVGGTRSYYPPEDMHLYGTYNPFTPHVSYKVVLACTWADILREWEIMQSIYVWADEIRIVFDEPIGTIPSPIEFDWVHLTVEGYTKVDILSESIVEPCTYELQAFDNVHTVIGPACLDSAGGSLVITPQAPTYTSGVTVELDSALSVDIRCGLIPMPQPPGNRMGVVAMVAADGVDPWPMGTVTFNVTDDTNYFRVDFNGAPYDVEFINNGAVVYTMENLTDTIPPIYQVAAKEEFTLADGVGAGVDTSTLNPDRDWQVSYRWEPPFPQWLADVLMEAEILRFIPRPYPLPCPPFCPPDPWWLAEVNFVVSGIDTAVISTETVTPTIHDIDTVNGLVHETGGWTDLETAGDELHLINQGPNFSGEVTIQLDGAARWDAAVAADPHPRPPCKLGMVTEEMGSVAFAIDDTSGYFEVDLEASSYTVQLLQDGELVYEMTGLTDPIPPIRQIPPGDKDSLLRVLADDIHHGPMGEAFTWALRKELMWEVVAMMNMPGNAVRIIPDDWPGPLPELQHVRLFMEGIDTLAISCESTNDIALTEAEAYGLNHTASGLGSFDTTGGGLLLDNGCTGYAGGVSIDVAPAVGWSGGWETGIIPQPVPPGRGLEIGLIGEIDGVPDENIGSVAYVIDDTSNYYVVLFDAPYIVELISGDSVVYRSDTLYDSIPPIHQAGSGRWEPPLLPDSVTCGPRLDDDDDDGPYINWDEIGYQIAMSNADEDIEWILEHPGEPLYARKIGFTVFGPCGPFGGDPPCPDWSVSNVNLMVRGAETVQFLGESAEAGIFHNGRAHVLTGDAFLEPGDSTLDIHGIGPSGEDGVTIYMRGEDNFTVSNGNIDPINLPSGAEFNQVITGIVDGVSGQPLGGRYVAFDGDSMLVAVDFGALAPDSIKWVTYDDGSPADSGMIIGDSGSEWIPCISYPDAESEGATIFRPPFDIRQILTWYDPLNPGNGTRQGASSRIEFSAFGVAASEVAMTHCAMTGVDLGMFSILSESGQSLDTCCVGIRGNVDYDPGDEIDISDLVYLVDYMFTGGAEPECWGEANIDGSDDGDGVDGPEDVDISDLVYLVDYMFNSGPPPPGCGQSAVSSFRAAAIDPKCSLEIGSVDGYTTITLNADCEIRGLQLQLTGAGAESVEKLVGDNVDFVYGLHDGVVKLGVLDLDGNETIAAGRHEIARLTGDYRVDFALAIDRDTRRLEPWVKTLSRSDLLPSSFALYPNYPNPFNPATEIRFDLPVATTVRLTVYNVLGQTVSTLVDGRCEAGRHVVSWDASAMASGVYFYRLRADAYTESRKMLLMK